MRRSNSASSLRSIGTPQKKFKAFSREELDRREPLDEDQSRRGMTRSISSPSSLDKNIQPLGFQMWNAIMNPSSKQPTNMHHSNLTNNSRVSESVNASSFQMRESFETDSKSKAYSEGVTKNQSLSSQNANIHTSKHTTLLAHHSTLSQKESYLQKQRSEASLDHLSVVQQLKQVSEEKDTLRSKLLHLQDEYNDMKIAFDRLREDRESAVETRFHKLGKSHSVLESIKAESRIFSPPSS